MTFILITTEKYDEILPKYSNLNFTEISSKDIWFTKLCLKWFLWESKKKDISVAN